MHIELDLQRCDLGNERCGLGAKQQVNSAIPQALIPQDKCMLTCVDDVSCELAKKTLESACKTTIIADLPQHQSPIVGYTFKQLRSNSLTTLTIFLYFNANLNDVIARCVTLGIIIVT